MRRLLLTAFALALAATPLRAESQLNVVASFSILADFVKNVGGDKVDVTSLVGANGDIHVFTPAPSDAKTVGDVKLLVINGLGLEGWLPRLVQSSGSKAAIVTASNGIAAAEAAARTPIPMPGNRSIMQRSMSPISVMRSPRPIPPMPGRFVPMRTAIWPSSMRSMRRCERLSQTSRPSGAG